MGEVYILAAILLFLLIVPASFAVDVSQFNSGKVDAELISVLKNSSDNETISLILISSNKLGKADTDNLNSLNAKIARNFSNSPSQKIQVNIRISL